MELVLKDWMSYFTFFILIAALNGLLATATAPRTLPSLATVGADPPLTAYPATDSWVSTLPILLFSWY